MEAEPLNSQRRVEPDWEEPPSSIDLISHLPDEMLHIIISLLPMISAILHIIISHLPTISAVSTTLVSKRSRHLWHSIPLNLEIDDQLAKQNHKHIAAVSSIIAAHPGPARSVSIDPFRSTCKVDTTLDSWFRSSTLSCVENLRFEGGIAMRSFPLSALRCAPTLRIVNIFTCYLPEIYADSMLLFPQLKKLMLYDVYISNLKLPFVIPPPVVDYQPYEWFFARSADGKCLMIILTVNHIVIAHGEVPPDIPYAANGRASATEVSSYYHLRL
ncbi:hypothetical protein QYE76_063647 [Lolium multiflorum]|uniref:F-box domain-containing protein n=1 Tax=Lolium multiflorum TaxID=4521 RepID=A0AAD8W9I1_LOLMU|nr:hypothetical protein QYE76_063647 [Lolium multiflorum]